MKERLFIAFLIIMILAPFFVGCGVVEQVEAQKVDSGPVGSERFDEQYCSSKISILEDNHTGNKYIVYRDAYYGLGLTPLLP